MMQWKKVKGTEQPERRTARTGAAPRQRMVGAAERQRTVGAAERPPRRGLCMGAALALVLSLSSAAAFAAPSISSRTTTEGDITTTVLTKTEEESNYTDRQVSTYVTNEATGERTRFVDGTFVNKPEAITVRTITTRAAVEGEERTTGSLRAIYDPTLYASASKTDADFQMESKSVDAAVSMLQGALADIPQPRDIAVTIGAKARIAGNERMALRFDKSTLSQVSGLFSSGLSGETEPGSLALDGQALKGALSQAGGSDLTISAEVTAAADADLSAVDYPGELEGYSIVELSVSSGGKEVTDFGSGQLSVTLPCLLKEGEKTSDVLVYALEATGALKAVENLRFDEKAATVSFESTALTRFAVGRKGPTAVFFDVRTGDWYKEAVTWLAGRGIVKGTTDILFGPEEGITRAELVQILYNKNGTPATSASSSFADVGASAWYAKAVSWAAEQGIVSGSAGPGGTLLFRPEDPVSRQDMAVILAAYMEKVEKKELKPESASGTAASEGAARAGLAGFSDGARIADYARQAVAVMQTSGIIGGEKTADGDVNFRPGAGATRAEAASMLAKLFRK